MTLLESVHYKLVQNLNNQADWSLCIKHNFEVPRAFLLSKNNTRWATNSQKKTTELQNQVLNFELSYNERTLTLFLQLNFT